MISSGVRAAAGCGSAGPDFSAILLLLFGGMFDQSKNFFTRKVVDSHRRRQTDDANFGRVREV